MDSLLIVLAGMIGLPLLALSIVGIVVSRKPVIKTLSIIVCVVVSLFIVCSYVIVEYVDVEPSSEQTQEGVLEFLDDFTEYGYSEKQIADMRKVLTNVGITEITDLEIQPVSAGMQVIKGTIYKDPVYKYTGKEVQVQFNIENGVIYLVSIYCPSYNTSNQPTYLSGLTDRRADLYYDVEGGYLKKIDWENKAVVDYD